MPRTGKVSEGQQQRLKQIIQREGVQPVRLGKGGLGGGEHRGKVYWQEAGGMTKEDMKEWWVDMGKPENWLLINWGKGEVTTEGGQIPERGWMTIDGKPVNGWEANGGIKLAALIQGMVTLEPEREVVLVTINVQGKMRDPMARLKVARYLHQAQADWGIGTETQLEKPVGRSLGGYAAKYSCLKGGEGGGNTGGVAHYYPREMEGNIDWWEPMQGRICVAKIMAAQERWIIGVYAPAHEGRDRTQFWEWIRVIRAFVEEENIAAIWGGDWNAVSDPSKDRSSAGEWDSGGDRGMRKAMVGKIRECTKESGPTWKGTRSEHQKGEREGSGEEAGGGEEGVQKKERWARLDSWWAMDGMKVEMVGKVNSIPVDFSQHRGVAVKWDIDKVEMEESVHQKLRKLPPREDPIWVKFRDRLAQLVHRALEDGGAAGEIAAAWEMAAREVFPMGKERHRTRQGKVPNLLSMTAWGPGKNARGGEEGRGEGEKDLDRS